jgi:hypothetical protein
MRQRRQAQAEGSGVALRFSDVQSLRCQDAAVVIEELRLIHGDNAEFVL